MGYNKKAYIQTREIFKNREERARELIAVGHELERAALEGRVGKVEEDGLHHYNDLMLG